MTATPPQTEKPQTVLRLSEGFGLAAIPVVMYVLSYSYERGYLTYFGVPEEAIVLDFASLLQVSVFLFVILFAISFVLWVLKPLWLIVLVFLGVIAGGVYSLVELHKPLALVLAIFIALGTTWYVSEWVRWYLQYRKDPTTKLPMGYDSSTSSSPGTLVLVGRAFGIKAPTAIGIVFFVFLYLSADALAETLAKSRAANTEWFFVNAKKPGQVMLGRSGDRWISAILDSATPSLIKFYAFPPIGSDSVVWEWRHLTPLHPPPCCQTR